MSLVPSSTSPSSSESTLQLAIPQKICEVCGHHAVTRNYGVLTCDACKMFFRRIVVLQREYECKKGGICWQNDELPIAKCRYCRFQKCLQVGMSILPEVLKVGKGNDANLSIFIEKLIHLDGMRGNCVRTQTTDDDFSLMEILVRGQMKKKMKTANYQPLQLDWSFFAVYCSVEFFLQLEFMQQLTTQEKYLLLRQSTAMCSLFAGAMRCYLEKKDYIATVDGKEIYTENLKKVLGLGDEDNEFLNRIRTFLVGQLIDLKITKEEFVLICVIVFCNPVVFSDPDNSRARNIIAAQQQQYSCVLCQYCKIIYDRNGWNRYLQLLRLVPIIQKNFDDVQYLTMCFKLAMKEKSIQFKKVIEELM